MMKFFWSIANQQNYRKDIKRTGFTLIEMVVAIAIAAIIIIIVIGNLGVARFKLAVNRSANRLSLDLHRAESDSLTSRSFNGSVPSGWGIHFYGPGTINYTIFADVVGNNQRAPDGSEDLESINVEAGVTITSSNVTDIVFTPPNPDIIFTPTTTVANIVLTSVDGSASKNIYINQFGAITVQ